MSKITNDSLTWSLYLYPCGNSGRQRVKRMAHLCAFDMMMITVSTSGWHYLTEDVFVWVSVFHCLTVLLLCVSVCVL